MYKDAGKICIDKLFESATTEENGLEVEVNVGYNHYSIREKISLGIKQLTFYNNIYIDDSKGLLCLDGSTTKEFNNRKIEDFKTFKVCNFGRIRNNLLMGNVLYPIDESIIKNWFQGLDYVPFAIKCNIGDVDITPSRETLLYSQKTINTINEKCKETLEEIKEICKNNFGSDFNTVADYCNFIEKGSIDVELKKFENNTINLTIPVNELNYYGLSEKVTIEGQVPPNNLLTYWKKLSYINLSSSLVIYNYYNERFHVKDNQLSIRRYVEAVQNSNVYLIDDLLKPVTKKYWIKTRKGHYNYYSYHFLYRKYIYHAFRRIVKDLFVTYNIKPSDTTLKFIFNNFIKNYTKLPTFNNSDVPQDYIDSFKAERKKVSITAQQKARKCVIYTLTEGRAYNSVSYDSNMYDYDTLSKFKGTIFFAEKDNTYLESFYNIYHRTNSFSHKILFVAVAQTNLPCLRELKNAVEFNTVFVTKNNLISKFCTYIYLTEKWHILNNSLYFSDEDSKIGEYKKLENFIYRLQQFRFTLSRYECNGVLPELLKSLCIVYYKNGWLNYRMINLIESNISYVKLNNLFNNSANFKDIIFAFYEYVTKNNITNQERLNRIKNTLKPFLNEYTPNSELPHFDIG